MIVGKSGVALPVPATRLNQFYTAIFLRGVDLPRNSARLGEGKNVYQFSRARYHRLWFIPRIDHEVHKSESSRRQRTPVRKSQTKDLLIRKEEHLQTDLDRNQGEEDFEPPHDLERPIETLDLALVLFDELGGEDVCPELR